MGRALDSNLTTGRRLGPALGVAALVFSAAVGAAEIEEVLVTAEKRESTLQDTPIAITAVTREELELRNIDDFAQLQFATPALVFAEIADMAQITMRGVGVDISTMDAEPGVALYADGVYRGGLTSSASLLFDLERIEVLRGPQGTLYGRNSTSPIAAQAATPAAITVAARSSTTAPLPASRLVRCESISLLALRL
jgi:iron complex outermembrane receptor protein